MAYKFVLGPALRALGNQGQECKFHPSCSEYAREAFLTLPFWKALFVSAKRIAKCNPWGAASGFDPVPGQQLKGILS